MWDAPGDEVFAASMQRQAEAFARAVRGEPREGAGGADAVAALTVAEMAAESLTHGGARVAARSWWRGERDQRAGAARGGYRDHRLRDDGQGP